MECIRFNRLVRFLLGGHLRDLFLASARFAMLCDAGGACHSSRQLSPARLVVDANVCRDRERERTHTHISSGSRSFTGSLKMFDVDVFVVGYFCSKGVLSSNKTIFRDRFNRAVYICIYVYISVASDGDGAVFRANGFGLTGGVAPIRRHDTILEILSPRLVATWLCSKPSSSFFDLFLSLLLLLPTLLNPPSRSFNPSMAR